MVPPDEFVIRLLDRMVLWFHNWGISRMWVTRVIYMALCLTAGASTIMGGSNFFTAMLITIIPVFILLFEEWRIKRLGAKWINASYVGLRASWVAWMRCGFMAGLIYDFLTNFNHWDSPFWVLSNLILWTYIPPDPPKHSVKELLGKRAMVTSGA